MKQEEIRGKIQELFASGQPVNTQIAIQLIASQLKISLEQALQDIKRVYQLKKESRTGEDFYLSLRLGPLLLEYDYSKRYAPYVGTVQRASRKIGIDREGQIQYQVNMNKHWEVKEWKTEEVKALFEEDYLQLIPYLAQTIESEINP